MTDTRPGYKQHIGTARSINPGDYIDVAFADGGFRVYNVNTTVTYERGILVGATLIDQPAANDGLYPEPRSRAVAGGREREHVEVEIPTASGVMRIKMSRLCSPTTDAPSRGEPER